MMMKILAFSIISTFLLLDCIKAGLLKGGHPSIDLLQDTLDRLEANTLRPGNPLYKDLTRSYVDPEYSQLANSNRYSTYPHSYAKSHKSDELLFDRIAHMEYLAHTAIEASLPGIAHALMAQMSRAVEGSPGIQTPTQEAIEGIRRRLGEGDIPYGGPHYRDIPISKVHHEDRAHRGDDLRHPRREQLPFVRPETHPRQHPGVPHINPPHHPPPPHHPSPPPQHHAPRERHRRPILHAIKKAFKKAIHKAGHKVEHAIDKTVHNVAQNHPIAAAVAQRTHGPMGSGGSHGPLSRFDQLRHDTQHSRLGDIANIAKEAAKQAVQHFLPTETLPGLLGRVLQAMLARQPQQALSLLASHHRDTFSRGSPDYYDPYSRGGGGHDSEQEAVGKLKLWVEIVMWDRDHYGTCVPLWDSDWQLSWTDKAQIMEALRSSPSSGRRTSFDLRLPHGESIRARMALASDSRENALRLIDHSIADPVEHTLLLACWQQKFSERGLEDALPTYRMLLNDQSHLSGLLGRQHNRDFVEQIIKDVRNGIATGRSDASIHTAPFITIFPSHAAIQPVSGDTPRTRYLKSAIERDMTLQRLREVLNISEHVDLSSAEQAANARIFQLYHKLHDLAKRDKIAKDLNDRGIRRDSDLKRQEMKKLERELRNAIKDELLAKAKAGAKQQRQILVDDALAKYNADMSQLHAKYRSKYQKIVDDIQSGRMDSDQRGQVHARLKEDQQRESDAIKAKYEHALKRAEREYQQFMADARRDVDDQAREQAHRDLRQRKGKKGDVWGGTKGKQGLVARMAEQAADFVKTKYEQPERGEGQPSMTPSQDNYAYDDYYAPPTH